MAAIYTFICGSKLAQIHKAGCHHAALSGRGGRESADGRADEECEKGGGLAQLNNIENIFQMAPALTGITSNFTFPQTAGSIEKRLPTPSPQGQAESDRNGHTGKVKGHYPALSHNLVISTFFVKYTNQSAKKLNHH